MKGMKIVISGGSGLVGRALTEKLANLGHEVVVLSRQPQGVSSLAAGVSVEGWDAVSVADLTPILEGVDAVVHLAGENIGAGRWTAKRKAAIRESRVRSTESLAQAFLGCRNPPHTLIQGSAVGFYGPQGDDPLTETGEPGADFLASVCRDWEAAGRGVEAAGVRRVIARTGVVFAKHGGALPRILLPFKLFAGGPIGSGDQVLSWIHLEDEASALAFLLMDEDVRGVFNLAAPNAVTNRELARTLGRILHRPSFLPTPGFVLRVALGEMATLVLDGQRAVPRNLLARGYEFRFPEVDAALENLLA